MAFLSSLDITGSALTAQKYRSDIISHNITNAKTTVTASGEPYRRQQVVFQERPMQFSDELKRAQSGGVRIAAVVESDREFQRVFDPDHPQADEEGYVLMPNVDTTEEIMDLMELSNAYDANLTALSVVKSMISKAMNLKTG